MDMTDIKSMFISFPSDYSPEERELISEAFRMGETETVEKKGFGEFMDLILASPDMVVITFVTSALATGIFRKLGGDIYDVVKKKLTEGFSKRLKAKLQFKIQLMHTELTVELNVKKLDQIDFVFKNITELIRKYEMNGVTDKVDDVCYRVTEDNHWEKIRPGQDPNEKEFKGGFRFQNYRNLSVFLPDETDYEHEYKVLRQDAIINNPFHTIIIDKHNQEEFAKMLELRKNVYINELGWIKAEDDFYDNEHAIYIIVYDKQKNHVGSMRILKPESRWMIEKEFKALLDGYEINKTNSIEITRLAISTENRHKLESMQASVRLFQGLFQWMTANRFLSLYMVVRPAYFKFFKIEGFCPEPLGIGIPEFDGVAGKIDLNITMPFLKENRYDLWEWITQKAD
jgi:N-acyl-L-homoserine lactone synthetase